MPAADVTCPVCAEPGPVAAASDTADIACRECGWPLFSGYRLGPLTTELERAFDDDMRAAIRGRDLAAVAAATSGLGRAEASLVRQISALARFRPVTAAELSTAAAPTPAPPRISAAQVAGRLAEAHHGQVSPAVAEIGVTGISTRTFSPDGRWEQAWCEAWSWAEIVTQLPADAAARRFWLAGGVGDGLPNRAALPKLACDWAEHAAARWPALAVLVEPPGWAVLDLFAAELARVSAAPAEPGLPPSVPPLARRLDSDTAAAAVVRTPDGEIVVATGDYDGQVRLDAVPGPGVREPELIRLRPAMTALALAPGLDAVAAGGRDGSVWVRSLAAGAAPQPVTAHGGRVTAVRFGPGVLVSLGSDGLLRSVQLKAAVPDPAGETVVDLGGSGTSALAVAARALRAVVGGSDGVLRLVDLAAGQRTDLPGLGLSVTSLAIDDAGRLLAAGLADGSVRLLDLPTRTWLAGLETGGGAVGPLCIAAADGQPVRLAVSNAQGEIYYWTGTADGEGTMTELGVHQGGTRELGLPGAGVVSIGREDRVLRLWSPPAAGGVR